MFCFSSYLSAFSRATERMGLEPFRPLCAESEGSLGERNAENGACCRFCKATKRDGGNIREHRCLQRNPVRLFWKLAYVFIACIPRKAANQCQFEQNKRGGALTSGSSAGRDGDFSCCCMRTCSTGHTSLHLPTPRWIPWEESAQG